MARQIISLRNNFYNTSNSLKRYSIKKYNDSIGIIGGGGIKSFRYYKIGFDRIK